MATYWMDNNGTTAGFGTLSAAWNTSGAFWTTDSTGVAAPAARAWTTLTQDDTAQFGNTGTAATAGTSQIANATTVLLNSLVTQNLAGLQTISATGTGKLSFGGSTTPTIVVGSAGGLLISAPISGTNGFIKSGANSLFLTGTGSDLTGTISVTSGNPAISATYPSVTGTTFGFPLNAALSLSNAGTIVYMVANAAATATLSGNVTIDAGTQISAGMGSTSITGANLVFTGNIAGDGKFNVNASIFGETGTTKFYKVKTSTMAVGELVFAPNGQSGSSTTRHAVYQYGGASNYDITCPVTIDNSASTSVNYNFAVIHNATSASGALTISGNISKTSSGAGGGVGTNLTFGSTTAGDDSGDIIVSGIVREVTDTGALNITKTSNSTTPRKLTFSGANTYKGTTTISAGTLSAQDSAALGVSSAGAVTVSAGGTLEITDGITVNKTSVQVNLSGTGSNSAGAVSVPSGATAGLTAANFVLSAGTNAIKIGEGGRLTLTSAGAISGATAGINTTGTGTLVLSQSGANSSFAGLIINSGTVEVPFGLANAGVVSTIGSGTSAANLQIGGNTTAGTFAYTGSVGTSTNRPYTIGVGGCTIDSSCSAGVLAMTSTAAPTFSTSGACTLTLAGAAGTYATPNTLGTPLANNGAATVGLTKSGAGAWAMTSSVSYTGTTTVSGGYLTFSNNTIGTSVTFNGNGATLGKVKLTGSSKTILCAAGAGNTAELISDDTGAAGNTITGSTNVTDGTLRLTTEQSLSSKPVKVTGDTNVTVSAGAALRTTTGTNQKGQMRYGGNLTFNSGSALYIGG